MLSMRKFVLSFHAIALFVLLIDAGCTNRVANSVAAANDSNIKRVANLCAAYAVNNDWQSPKNEADLKDFAQHRMAAKKIEMMGIDLGNLDAILISERDNKPFKVRYGIALPFRSVTPVVFEQDGVGGQKQVAFNNGQVQEVNDTEYQRLWGEKSAPAPASTPSGKEKTSGDGTNQFHAVQVKLPVEFPIQIVRADKQ
jgi:hypothetical protein